MQNDCNLVLYTAGNKVVWAANSGPCRPSHSPSPPTPHHGPSPSPPPHHGPSPGRTGSFDFNVMDAPFHASGDGVTDDTSAFQAALNAASAKGGGIVFAPA